MTSGGGALVYIWSWISSSLKKKNQVIRVVFQDQAVYARTSFGSAKTCKIGKKGCGFGHIDNFWKGLLTGHRNYYHPRSTHALLLHRAYTTVTNIDITNQYKETNEYNGTFSINIQSNNLTGDRTWWHNNRFKTWLTGRPRCD